MAPGQATPIATCFLKVGRLQGGVCRRAQPRTHGCLRPGWDWRKAESKSWGQQGQCL